MEMIVYELTKSFVDDQWLDCRTHVSLQIGYVMRQANGASNRITSEGAQIAPDLVKPRPRGLGAVLKSERSVAPLARPGTCDL
jgi:hypothetical protein